MACKIEFTTTRKGYYTITGPDGNKLTKEGGSLLQVTSRDECYERITQHGQDGTYTIHAPEREVGLVIIDDSTQPTPPNESPSWNTTPTPIFTQGTLGTYNLNQDASDPEETLTYATATASPAWPSNVTLASNGLITSSASAGAAITSSLLVLANDGVNAVVTSPAFNINITGATAKRWNPGHYIKPQSDPFEENNTQSIYYSFMQGQLSNQAQQIPELKGIMFAVPWGHMETAPGVYDWSRIDPLIDQAENQGQGIMILLHWKSFLWPKNQPPSPLKPKLWEAPADILNSKVSQHNQGYLANIWETAIADRFIDAMEAIADRYDNRPGMEGILTPEAVPSFAGVPQPPTFQGNGPYAEELKRIISAMSNAFVKTNVFPQINALNGELTNLFEHTYALGDGIGSPDARETTGWLFFEGTESGGETPPRDYRTQLSRHTTISTSAYSKTGRTPAQVIDLMQTQKVTHAAWITSTNWEAAKSAIQADPNLHLTCPTRYGSCET